jgi:HAD superfamily hydrolase (TIGR01509 family)
VGTGEGRLVVFDCDGVLVDSERLNVDLDVLAIGELGWPITREEVIARHVGLSEADATADIESVIGRPIPPEWLARWRGLYQAAYDTELAAVPGVAAAIEELVADGWAACVATSGERSATWRKLTRCRLEGWFTDASVFTAADVVRGKPAPDLFLWAAQRMGFAPERCVVVEDSPHGVAAARAAGMPCIGFAGSVTSRAQLADADLIIDDMAGLVAAIRTLLGA